MPRRAGNKGGLPRDEPPSRDEVEDAVRAALDALKPRAGTPRRRAPAGRRPGRADERGPTLRRS